MVKLYDRSNVIGAFSALNSLSIGYENNNPSTIQFTDNGNTISFQLFNLQEIIGSTITTTYDPIQTLSTGPEYNSRIFDVFNFLSDQVFQGFSPGPTYVGGVVAAYPNFASFPVTGTESVIYIDEADNSAYYWDGSSYQLLVSTGVEEYANFASFPITGSANVIYIDMSNFKPYVWDGSAYQSIGGSATWGSITGTLSAQTDLQSALNAKFDDPTGTTSEYIRGDGTLATFPTITSGTVTSVDLTAGTGISVSGGPITSSGSITVTNSAPDQTVVLNSGTGISTSGTYPNFTITNSAPDQTVALTAGTGIGVTGTYPNFTITNSSPSSGGTVTSVGTTGLISGGPITSSGTITTSMATNKLVGRYSASTGIMEEISVGSGLTLTGAGVLNNTATPTPIGYYGAFQDSTRQIAAAINTPYAVKLNTTDLSDGITIVNNGSGDPTRITIANTGVYNIQFSLQLEKSGGSGNMTADIWLRKNGVDVPSTTGKVVLTGSVNASPVIAAWNYVLDVVGGSYYELMWAVSNIHVEIFSEVATPPHPATPSAILTVTQQSGIMAGTGITAINSLTGAVQTLATGTTGTDFAISSIGTSHTFDLPTASATNRGALSSTDWSTFNGKFNLPALTSGSVLFSNGTTIAQSNSQLFWDSTNNRLGIGTNTPTVPLEVNGSSRLGFTRSTDIFVIGGTATTNTANARFWSSGGQAPTSGLYRGFYTDISFIPSSGTAEWYGLDLRPTINQTGGASGVTRGLYIAPTLTSAANFRAIEVSSGGAYINTTSVAASAILQADSTTKGFLPPRMTTAQKNAIASPASGLVVFDTDLKQICTYNGTWGNSPFYQQALGGVKYFTDFDNTASSTLNLATFVGGASAFVVRNAVTIPNQTSNQIGFAQYQTGLSSTGYANHFTEGNVGRQFVFGGGSWVFETFVNVETLSTVTERFRFVTGFGDNPTNASDSNAVLFTYDEGGVQNGTVASPNWQCVTSVGAVRTLTTTSTAVVASAWVKLRIEVNAAGTSVTFYVNGTLVATHTTNIPTFVSAANPRGFNVKQSILKSIGTANRSVFCDYLLYENNLTTLR
jgi:hypothetical protein